MSKVIEVLLFLDRQQWEEFSLRCAKEGIIPLSLATEILDSAMKDWSDRWDSGDLNSCDFHGLKDD